MRPFLIILAILILAAFARGTINTGPALFLVSIFVIGAAWHYRKPLVLGFLALFGYRSLHRKLDRIGDQRASRPDDV